MKPTIYHKITFMNHTEEDPYETFQQTTARPFATRQTPEIAGWYLKGYHKISSKTNPLNKIQRTELKQFVEKIERRIESNSIFKLGITDIAWCTALVNDPQLIDPLAQLAAMVLGKSTNQGLKEFDQLVDMTGITGSGYATESFAKKILVEEYNVDDALFQLQDSVGANRLIYDSTKNEIRYDSEKSEFRSIDALMPLDNCYIIVCMKYKGGTAAASGSGQSDQATEAIHIAKHIEDNAKNGNRLTYNGKPVFYANLVYGAQFQGTKGIKRIYENELSLRRGAKGVSQCFNISLSMLNIVATAINTELKNNTPMQDVLKNVYNLHGLNIEVKGKNQDVLKEYV